MAHEYRKEHIGFCPECGLEIYTVYGCGEDGLSNMHQVCHCLPGGMTMSIDHTIKKIEDGIKDLKK
jgi:hypothetical protein